ncbi:MAG TPA: glycosyltransferase 87 family protein, partial [Ktedonobacteraceae bacterium]
YLALIFVAWKVIRPELRPWLILLSLANIPMWSSTVGGNLDVFYTLLIVLVWLCREKRWQSAALLGLAIASKQIAWFFTPYYLIMVWRTYGFKEAVYRGIIASGVALAVNLPFIIWNAHAWLSGVMAPMADPMFPLGVGVISLSTSHLIPYLSQTVYTVLELLGIIVCLGIYWRICRKYPEAAMLLGVIPLFFAWRSLSSYFYCVAYPLFILLAVRLQENHKQKKLLAQREEAPDNPLPLHATI